VGTGWNFWAWLGALCLLLYYSKYLMINDNNEQAGDFDLRDLLHPSHPWMTIHTYDFLAAYLATVSGHPVPNND